MKVAEVVVNIPTRALNQTYSYYIPDLLSFISVGWRVVVPFGSREVEAFVIATNNNVCNQELELKTIKAALEEFAWFDSAMLNLALWLTNYYLCTLAEALRLFIPGKSGTTTEYYYCLGDAVDLPPALHHLEADLLEFVKARQPVPRKALYNRFGNESLPMLAKLLKTNILTVTVKTKRRQQTKFAIQYYLTDPLAAQALLPEYAARKPAQYRLLKILLDQSYIDRSQIKQIAIANSSLQALINMGIVSLKKIPSFRSSYALVEQPINSVKRFTDEQTVAFNLIQDAMLNQQYQLFLLHGITGSGKTEIYIEAAGVARAKGQQVIVLVPEIALTSQLVERFQSRFNEDVVVFHSKLSLQERYDVWQQLREHTVGIVIGARSALFAPVPNLGLIIMDEEHEFTYKQEESPRYHTRTVAAKRAQLANAVLVLGSATPAVETYQAALQQQCQQLTLSKRADGAVLPTATVVDMREELRTGNRQVISRKLANLLAETFERQEQAIVLLNRRGHSTFLLCRECGHVLRCRHCSVSLVYHNDSSLRCHYCGAQELTPDVCPACESRYLRYFGAGTQKAEVELKQLFPAARILRMDQDTTSSRFGADNILREFKSGKYDLLLGTQMVAKGHDIANVTAVGILAADSTLNLPDFRAAEKTFSLITQAAGRAGRGHKPGSVVVQTYNPEHYAIQTAIAQNYKAFFHTEIEYRRQLQYPPFSRLLRVTIFSLQEQVAWQNANLLVTALQCVVRGEQIEVQGPFPAAIAKVNNEFRIIILLKGNITLDTKHKLSVMPELFRPGVAIDVDPLNLL